ncbi:hypothetical protein Dda_7104 [Drechslerella dactyloides]|uniref:Uncharacterized protein n=1 Tax=Drechslerella dactyloides TaxID=74499 RepID=A0AAD6IT60_DREDA|nr:hypothetical protein Dda_7104 [Drechslerella dactyloides]
MANMENCSFRDTISGLRKLKSDDYVLKAAPKAKRPPLKRGSPGTSSYEPSKEPPTASLPVPPTDGKRKDATPA